MNSYTKTNTLEDLEKLYDTLSLSTVVKRTLNYLSAKINCENIFWVLAEEADLIFAAGENFKPEPKLDRTVMLTSQSTISDELLLKTILSLKIDRQKERLIKDGKLSTTTQGKSNFVIPLYDYKENKMLAYIIFVKSMESEKKTALQKAQNFLEVMFRHLKFCIQHYKIQEKSYIDDVTSLYNQRYLPMVLDSEISRAKRSQTSFAVLFIDVDYFKAVNDTCGHMVGSQILIEMSKIIKSHIRTSDFAFRYGGDEFVIILTQTDVKKAEIVAERIRKAVEETSFSVDGGPADLKLTVSVGLAGFPEHAKSSSEIIQMADDAMYLAKSKSRNTVYVTAS